MTLHNALGEKSEGNSIKRAEQFETSRVQNDEKIHSLGGELVIARRGIAALILPLDFMVLAGRGLCGGRG
jgi:hypothetical protein